ncbi:MAG TPA: pitrilysin family protein [Thermoanaerobaculia bacterium]|nr:pitrilysin family protein [Thermoanaerobaculia bacterium]
MSWTALALLVLLPAAGAGAEKGSAPTPRPIPERPEALLDAPHQPRLPDPRAHRRELTGGVPLYLAEDHALPLAEVTLLLRVGDFLEPLGETGRAALTARSWRRGGTTRLAPAAFEEALERLGGRLSVSPGLAHTSVTLNVLAANLPAALDLLFELLAHPGFEAGALAAEQRATFEAMLKRNEDLAVLGARTWDRLANGPEHFAARLPTAAEVVKHDRAAVAAFHQRWWGPRNLVVAVSGTVEPDALVRQLEKGLAEWGNAAEPAPWPQAQPAGAAPGWRWLNRPGPQSWLALGGPGLSWAGRWEDPRLYATALAHEILIGGGFPSRLVGRLREAEGLVYFPASEPGLGPLWPVPWQIRFQTRPESMERAITIVREELARLGAEAPSPGELDLARTSLLSRLARGLESRRDRAVAFALDELQGRPLDFWPRAAERYGAATPAQVQAAARQLYAAPVWVLEVGPEGTLRSAAAAAGAEVEELPLLDPMTLKPGG